MRLVLYRGVFCAYWTNDAGKPRRTSMGTPIRELAERRLADFTAKRTGTVVTVGDAFEKYLNDKGNERARFAWKRLAPTFSHLRPDQVNREICRAYIVQRQQAGILDGTIIKELSALRAALKRHDKNTLASFEMPPEPPPKSRHLTRVQYRALRAAAGRIPHLHMFVVLAYTTAGRASAVLDLTWDRVDFERGQIQLGQGDKRTKGRATVPMTDGMRQVLVDAKRASVSNYVVEYAGRRVISVKRAFAAAAERAGVPWCTPHVLRHTAAVHMVESGVPIEQVGQYLGHTTLTVTYRVYARFTPGFLRNAAATLE